MSNIIPFPQKKGSANSANESEDSFIANDLTEDITYEEPRLPYTFFDISSDQLNINGHKMFYSTPDGYKFRPDGKIDLIENKKSKSVCSHFIAPLCLYEDISTGEESLQIAFYRDRKWKTLDVEKTQVYTSRGVNDLSRYGVSVSSSNASRLASYLQAMQDENREYLPRVKAVSHMGWNEDCTMFVPYADNLAYKGKENYIREYNAVHASTDKVNDWLDLIRPIRNDDYVATRIYLAASFASVLVKPTSTLPFMVHVWGPSGTGKSVALMTAASVWADPNLQGPYIKSFYGTDVSQEQMAGFCTNLPLCLNELQMIQDQKSFDQIIYHLCEGSPKGRATKDCGLRKQNGWQNCILTNGEQPVTNEQSRAGAKNRVIEIECSKPLFPYDKLGISQYCEKLRNTYGIAGKQFIAYLTQDDHWANARSLFEKYSRELSKSSVTGKQVLPAALILTADTLIEDLFFKDGVKLQISDILPYLKTESDVDVGMQAFETLRTWVSDNAEKFIGFDRADVPGETYGRWLTNADIGQSLAILPKILESVMKNHGFDYSSFLSWLSNNGRLWKDSDGHKKRNVPMPDGVQRCVCVILEPQQTAEALIEQPMQ